MPLIQNIMVPDSGAECGEWISYFNKLKDKFGEDNARTLWLMTWKKKGSTSCTTKPDFNNFLTRHKIDVSNIGTKMIAGATEIGGDLLGMGKTLSKIMIYAIPVIGVVVLGTVVVVAIRISKNTSVGDIAKLTPQGAVAGALTSKP